MYGFPAAAAAAAILLPFVMQIVLSLPQYDQNVAASTAQSSAPPPPYLGEVNAAETQRILQKIHEVNSQHGYIKRQAKPHKVDYLYLPSLFSRNAPVAHVHRKKRQLDFQDAAQYPQINGIDYPMMVVDKHQMLFDSQHPLQVVFDGQLMGRPLHLVDLVHTINPAPPQLSSYGLPNIAAAAAQQGMQIRNIIYQQQTIIPIMSTENMVSPMMPFQLEDSHADIEPSGQMRQVSFPMSEYFPIVIKNPFQMMFNAMTSIIQYGPAAGPTPPLICRSLPNNADNATPDESKESAVKVIRIRKAGSAQERERAPKLVANYTDVGHITSQMLQTVSPKPAISFSAEFGRRNVRTTTTTTSDESAKINPFRPPSQWFGGGNVDKRKPTHPDPPASSSADDYDYSEMEGFSSPGGGGGGSDHMSANSKFGLNSNRKRIISRDNTGSGVFIHKLKVKKGGVAIAGPGGIATAGSGGTAIVGPNGFAFTHPDSLAIAGAGTKVVAVEPSVDLSALLRMNHTRKGAAGIGDASRLGKVVAVGPVVYYNKG